MLEAMSMLDEDVDAHLWLHGANLELQTPEFQEEFAAMHEELRGRVTFRGPYDHAELPKLMADLHWVVVPSIWWENSPLVIQEAFFHRRPMICSDVGGMAEKVRDGVDGIHFRVGDAYSLARTIEDATREPAAVAVAARRHPRAPRHGRPCRVAAADLRRADREQGGGARPCMSGRWSDEGMAELPAAAHLRAALLGSGLALLIAGREPRVLGGLGSGPKVAIVGAEEVRRHRADGPEDARSARIWRRWTARSARRSSPS